MSSNSADFDLAAALDTMRGICSRVEADLRLPPGFLSDPPGESDWTFVVKAGAVAEAALNQLLIAAVNDERLHAAISRLRLRGPDGKLALATDLGLIGTPERRFLERVGQLRNTAVHDVHSFSLTFVTLLKDMQPQDENQFWRDFLGVVTQEPPASGRAIKWGETAKLMIWIALTTFLGRLHSNKSVLSLERQMEELQRRSDAEHAARFRKLVEMVTPVASSNPESEHP